MSNQVFAEREHIRVRPYSRVFSTQDVSLFSVIEQEGLSKDVEKKLANIKLGDAPQVGEQRVYTNKAIAEAIRLSAIKKTWLIQIPHQVIVENKGFEVDRETISKQLVSSWTQYCNECKFNITTLQMPNMPKENMQFPWTLSVDPRLPRGNFSAKLVVNGSESRVLTYWVNGQVEIQKRVPVLVRSTPMNTRLTEEDFKMDWRNITSATDSSPTSEMIIGQKTKYSMNADDIIWSGSLIREKAVQRGEIVKVMVGDDNWNVSIQAQTEQDGYVGDTVNLKNIQTNRMITGRVIANGKVELK